MGVLQPHKYTKGVFPIDEQPNSHSSCNHIEDSLSQAMARPAVWELPLVIIQLGRQGGQEKPAIQET